MEETGRLVVGVDGADPSLDALRWTLAEAALRGATVEAVRVWQYPPLTYLPGVTAPPAFAHDQLEAEARALLGEAVDVVVAEDATRVPVEQLLMEGGPVDALLQRSRGADLLVVGHRGRGGFRELLLGSVAHQCSSHAACPVVIVRPRSPEN